MHITTRITENKLSRLCRNNNTPINMLSTSFKTCKNTKKQLNVFENDLPSGDNKTTESER